MLKTFLVITSIAAGTSAAAIAGVPSIVDAPTFKFPPPPVVFVTGERSGQERLADLMKPHWKASNPITASVVNAIDPDGIKVLDRRDPTSGRSECTYRLVDDETAFVCS